MATMLAFCETKDGEHWANAWKQGKGSRHEMFDKLGVKCRTFRDANDHNSTTVLFEIPDMSKFDVFLETDEIKRAMAEDGLKVETLRMLTEFTP